MRRCAGSYKKTSQSGISSSSSSSLSLSSLVSNVGQGLDLSYQFATGLQCILEKRTGWGYLSLRPRYGKWHEKTLRSCARSQGRVVGAQTTMKADLVQQVKTLQEEEILKQQLTWAEFAAKTRMKSPNRTTMVRTFRAVGRPPN